MKITETLLNKVLVFAMAALLLCPILSSCSEQTEADEYENWQPKNDHYIDSLAQVVESGSDPSWTRILAYTMGDDASVYTNPNYYIYVQKLEKGTGTVSPLYRDSVRVHYSGRLLPTDLHPQGLNFDKSYVLSSFNAATDVPALGSVDDFVVGYTTALMSMVEGDRWRVVIPYYLAYGAKGKGNVPGYSTLIFDMQLAKIYRYKIDTDTSWH